MNSLNFNHLFYFWIVSKSESIAKAASELKISSPSLSTQIKQLESNIGEELFFRKGRSLKLSDQGVLLKKHCDNIFFEYNQLDRLIKGGKELGAISDFKCGVSANISKHLEYLFLSELLNSEMNLRIKSDSHAELLAGLLDFKYDFIITNDLEIPADKSLKVLKLHESPYVIARNSLCSKGEEIPFSLQNCSSLSLNYIRSFVEKNYPQAQVKSIIDDTSLLRLYAKKSCGHVVMPKIGLYDEILSKEVEIVEELDIVESYFLITTDHILKILDLDSYATEFKEKYARL